MTDWGFFARTLCWKANVEARRKDPIKAGNENRLAKLMLGRLRQNTPNSQEFTDPRFEIQEDSPEIEGHPSFCNRAAFIFFAVHSVMALWFISFLLFFSGLWLLLSQFDFKAVLWGARLEKAALLLIVARLQEIEEMLGAGMVPTPSHWSGLQQLGPPWGRLAFDSLQELRAQGGAVLPTLRRLKELAQTHRDVLAQTESRSAQALAQALVAGVLVPVFGFVLYGILPGISERPWAWLFGCILGLGSSLTGAWWMLRLADAARWAGLKQVERPWVLGVQCTGERLLALVRAGTPADLAWSRALEFLNAVAPELALEWGYSIWATEPKPNTSKVSHAARKVLLELGSGLRKSVQTAILDGRPCMERVESSLTGCRQDLQALVDRELSLLPTRILKPLFVFVAPAILGLLAFGLYLAFTATEGGGLDVF